LRAAVTGGAGFVGAALIRLLLLENWDVAALARTPSKFSPQPGLSLTSGDLKNVGALSEIARGADVFFHLAGVTHGRRNKEYFDVNVEGAARAAEAAARHGAPFINISSLSARAPDASPYAQSKREGEKAVAEASGTNPWATLRLPAIYGPGDRATLPYFKFVKAGFALEPKTDPPARASLLFVDDAASAIMAARTAAPGVIYEIGDERPEGWTWSEIGASLGAVFGRPPKRIRAPRAALSAFAAISRAADRVMGRTPSLRAGQINELFHPDWTARDNLFAAAAPWRPQTPLKEGLAKTVFWYQENGLL
jgi:nucleoside-diphosphate-sugar epimerase